MPRIFDFNLEIFDRSATVASILALKNSDTKMTEVTAFSTEDAAAAEAAGIEMAVTDPEMIPAVREGSTRLFISAAIDFAPIPPVTEDEVVHAAVKAMALGADAIHTARRPQTIRRLTDEKIPVMAHVGFVPRVSTHLGGIRAVGKTAEEASQIWDDVRRLEDAGAFSVECELITTGMMSEITKRTSMATISLGSGPDGDIIGLFTSDVCGEGPSIPRHARTYADLNALHEKIRQEKFRALAEFRADVISSQYPNESEAIATDDKELDRFKEMLEKSS